MEEIRETRIPIRELARRGEWGRKMEKERKKRGREKKKKKKQEAGQNRAVSKGPALQRRNCLPALEIIMTEAGLI